MKSLLGTIAGLLFLSVLLIGCSSSRQSSAGTSTEPSTAAPAETPAKEEAVKSDTLDVKMEDEQKPQYESNAWPSQSGAYAVQVGAYKMQDNADRIVAMTRERFSVAVNSILDRTSGLYKVMVGNFTTKDEARRFRDEMVQRYPNDYKDAWVSEIPQN
jgi:cell division septation protein DedD